ncbi:hypothetical protein PGUG_01292 [Meyerozyma guilliermondii ATCC 6260]|uniref:Zn(2)-C6 fungal-type domain-containing protein n=1 Tax=Meyerozyma guilliermondii (strain ATCC 6260 / CBS 566 / DSM 6381 / JCM 1539 / NBRC 10279 / NRRL Y-324) TaxID=294746 RepID=A5DDE1_PICGU|nr:uncharacterized protein PGUG_01292 [Meyerozyma guilliermondii ATCC 6260]EDK37194.2 hypothetical protein PGUG_01292 [Meyerozyma guilliermondii ATCC 6260]
MELPKPKPKPKPKARKNGSTNTKTIMAPGAAQERVAQACDRCRAKKTKCDGKQPSCSNCAAVGFKCIVSDKLSRRAFPRGYTETLEERIRQLETENRKLAGLLEMRQEQLELMNNKVGETLVDKSQSKREVSPMENGLVVDTIVEPRQAITSLNLSLLDNQNSHWHEHQKGCPCGCAQFPHTVHERPVSLAGSVGPPSLANSVTGSLAGSIVSDDDDSLLSFDEPQNNYSGEKPAPGAFAAATAIAEMQKSTNHPVDERSKQQLLTSLVAMSIPRSTEETLFVPTLLAKFCQSFGYKSKQSVLAAHTLASLKEPVPSTGSSRPNVRFLMDREDFALSESEVLALLKLIQLPSRIDLDQLITTYFQDWGSAFPILNKNAFMSGYAKLTATMEHNRVQEVDQKYESIEKFTAIVVIVVALSLVSNKNTHIRGDSKGTEWYSESLAHYDYLIHHFIRPNCIITKYCSIQSLQVLSLAMQYCLVVGDITTCYELRGRLITMAQQLRLHRCPAAVLGISGDGNAEFRNFLQGERRILFWCVYCLDIYSSLNLGVPRLLKDFEIECALPFAGRNDDSDDENENIVMINNTKLSIVGKVSKFALAVILYCKVLGKILDSIFSRFENDDIYNKALVRDGMLDNWRRELPAELKFDIDVSAFNIGENGEAKNGWTHYSKQQLTLIFLFCHAKILAYLPILSKYGNHHDVGLSKKEQLTKGTGQVGSIMSSVTMIQQSSTQILDMMKSISTSPSPFVIPVPLNLPRQQIRLALLVARGCLDYTKGGPLRLHSKKLLDGTVCYLKCESRLNIPGCASMNSAKLLELTVSGVLSPNTSKQPASEVKFKPQPSNQPITKTAVVREPQHRFGNPFSNTKSQDESYQIPDSNLQGESEKMDRRGSTTSSDYQFPTNDGDEEPPTESDGIESLLSFDPFKLDLKGPLHMNDFAADGSLGLAPFLDQAETLEWSITQDGKEEFENNADAFFEWN